MRILFTGGGTAGHVNPLLAIAADFKARQPDAEFLFAASARPNDKAGDLVPRAGWELKTVHIRGMMRPVWAHPSNLTLPFAMRRAKREARALIEDFRPDLVVGSGGFACWPVAAAASAAGIPTVLHESNAQPGKAVIRLAPHMDRVLINFPETAGRLGLPEGDTRVVRVGNPHMPGFGTTSREDARRALGIAPDETYVVAFGGSLGAEHVNLAAASLAETIARKYPRVNLLHAAGKRDYEHMKTVYAASAAADCPRVRLVDYIYDMPLRMAAADLVISRAGAMTLSELALTGKAAVLIPSPYVTDNHQLKNAMSLVNAGAGVCVEEADLGDGALTEAVERLLADPAGMRRMGRNVRETFACPDANDRIYRELMTVCGRPV